MARFRASYSLVSKLHGSAPSRYRSSKTDRSIVLPTGHHPAERLEVRLGMTLPQVDGEVCHAAGMRAVMAEGAGAERPADAIEGLRRGPLDHCADHASVPLGLARLVERVVIDGSRGVAQDAGAG